jgi:predicted RNase H-related nuclease YkuK (DUF458 family)
MTYTRDYSFREAYNEYYDSWSTEGSINCLLKYSSKINTANKPVKFKLSRMPSVRYPRFYLEILANGADNTYNRRNIEHFLNKNILIDDPFMYSIGGISGILRDNCNIISMVICTNSSIEDYKFLLKLNEKNKMNSVKANIYDEVDLTIESDYSLKYIIEVGSNALTIGHSLREQLEDSDENYIYELTDQRDEEKLLYREFFDKS